MPLSYTEQFQFVLSFNVAPYFQLKKHVLFIELKLETDRNYYVYEGGCSTSTSRSFR